MSIFRAVFSAVVLVFLTASTSFADFKDGDYDVQAWCVTGPDTVFDDAITGSTSSLNVNDRPHIHVGHLVNDGIIPNREALYGQAFVFTGYWSVEGAQQHFNAYVPKGEVLEKTTCKKAEEFQPEQRVREYIEDRDFETATREGLGSSGSTPSHDGRRRGSE